MKKNKNLPMRALSVVGVSSSGKTTLVEELVKELTKRGYSVGTVKSIGCGRGCIAHKEGKCSGSNHHPKYGFTIDTSGKNSFRHREAGSQQISTWAKGETAFIHSYQMKLYEIIDRYNYDFLIVEGGRRYSLPKITTGLDEETTKKRMTNMTFAISGKIADEVEEIEGIKTFKTFEDIEKLVDLVEEKVYPAIGFRDEIGCKKCGMTCAELSENILKGEKTYLDCIRAYPKIQVNLAEEKKEELRKLLIQLDLEDFPESIKIELE